ncbi:hypothetical protein KAU40_02810 [Candidatus Parcubacteria bacterium]|nr:hypothetical protein [Candidatus Parcubacteria bacterium]
MKKNQIIILGVVVVLILVWIISLSISPAEKVPTDKEITPVGDEVKKPVEQVFSLSGKVSSVSAENNFLMVKPRNQETEVKVVISDTTKLIKLELPFDPANPPKDVPLVAEQTEIALSDFQEGDNIFIKTNENIAGKTEFNSVNFIHILP